MSTIDDMAVLEDTLQVNCGAADPTGNWIGGGVPHTNRPESRYRDLARWSAIQWWYYEYLQTFMGAGRSDAHVLDLGCAGGSHCLQLRRHYATVTGLDRDARVLAWAAAHNAAPGVTYVSASWPVDTLVDLDRIFAIEVLEHTPLALQSTMLKTMLAALRPDGLLGLTVPNEPPQPPPHVGCRVTESFLALIESVGRVVRCGWFSNAAPGDPCSCAWDPVSTTTASHNYAILAPSE